MEMQNESRYTFPPTKDQCGFAWQLFTPVHVEHVVENLED